MEDFPAKIADLLETIAVRVREMTVDRIASATKWTAVGIVLAVMGLVATFFLLVGLTRLLGELIGFETTYAIVGGLFVILGMFLWRRRTPKPASEE